MYKPILIIGAGLAGAEAAYFLAEKRSFQPGHELEDWLVAEQHISSLKQSL